MIFRNLSQFNFVFKKRYNISAEKFFFLQKNTCIFHILQQDKSNLFIASRSSVSNHITFDNAEDETGQQTKDENEQYKSKKYVPIVHCFVSLLVNKLTVRRSFQVKVILYSIYSISKEITILLSFMMKK